MKPKGDDDCGDSSDEPETCTSRVCSANYFKCSTGRCIPLRYKLFIQFFFLMIAIQTFSILQLEM